MPVRPLPAALGVLICLLGGAFAAHAAPPAPAFTLKLLESGETFDSRALIGKKPVVVRFQASWCKPCAADAAAFERAWRTYGARGVEFVAVHVQDTEGDARQFLRAHGATYPAGLDPKLRVANLFKAKGTPYTVVVDKKGEIVARLAGRADDRRLATTLDPLLREPPKKKPPRRLQ
jgi:peroxiredoxin